MRAFQLASWLCLLLMAAGASGARAQGGDASVATARALFDEGLRHVDAEQWSQAADCFARLLELRYSPVAAYNLALARARLGENVRALNSLRELLAQPGLEATVREAAQSLKHEAEANVGWVTVHVRGSCTGRLAPDGRDPSDDNRSPALRGGSGCLVRLDGQPWPAATPGVPVPVDPGHHALSLVRDDELVASTDVTVAPGARFEASLVAEGEPPAELLPQSTAVQQAAPTSSAPDIVFGQPSAPKERSSSLFASPWFWGGVGVLAAGMVTLGVVLSSGGTQEASPVPGDFKPGVISGVVQ